jgi:NTE family protein
VPIAPTFDDHTDLTLAVNLGGPLDLSLEKKTVRPTTESELSPFRKNIQRYIDQWQTDTGDQNQKDWGVYDLANMAFDAMQSTIARQKLAAYPPDVSIEIPRNACGTLEFDRAAEMIDLGRHKARNCIAQARKQGSA